MFPAPWEWSTDPTPNRDIAIIVDPYPEDLNDSIDSDISQPSYLPEAPLSEASAGSYPLPSVEPSHGMRTRTRAAVEAGRTRREFHFYDYSSNTTDEDLSVPLEAPTLISDPERTGP